MGRLARLTVAAAALGLAGCVQFNWRRESRYAPVDPSAFEELDEEGVDLTRCLALFGAPLWVREDAGGKGAMLAYGWLENRDLGLTVSVPLYRGYSGSIDLDKLDSRMKGLVLFFDESWNLRSWHVGLLRDLTREEPRPAFIDESS